MAEKLTEQQLCDKIARKLHRAEAEMSCVVNELVPELIKMVPACSKTDWTQANRNMFKGLAIIMCAHAEMGDCRDRDFPDVTPQGGGT